MSLPSISSYKDALRTPEHSLQLLSHLEPVPGVHDDFYFSSGNFAVVFKMKDTSDGSFKALKCFTRDQERRKESLHLISNYLNQIQSEYIIPYTYLEDEIWADDADHPVLLMDWIEGETLGEHVSKLCESHDRYALERLCQEFVSFSLWLLDQPWAHGDLKHDNILVRPDGSLVLVDFDGCFVPGMGGQEAREMGSPSFRHPNRTIKDFDRHLDDFSILVIFLSLRILAAEPALRQEQQDGENLVLSIGDISNPATSVMLEQFRRHSDSFLKAAIALLDMSVSFPAGQIFGLREVLKKWLDEEMELALQVPAHMVYVQGGTFEMGAAMGVMGDKEDDEDEDEMVHTVTLSNFLLAKNQLTFDEFDAFCKATGRALPSDSGWGRGKRLVINLDWYDAVEYCNWRSGQEGLQAVYSINKNSKDSKNSSVYDNKKWLVITSRSANGYRLPTEAEWEYAARHGGKKVRFGYWEDIADPKEINIDASTSGEEAYSIFGEYRQKTLPVGSFSPNTFDLFDMSGNVLEWCGDWYGPYPNSASNDPQGATGGSYRVVRGESLYYDHFYARSAYRSLNTPDDRDNGIGFRLARTIVSPEKQRELETWNKIPKNDLSLLEGYIRDNTQSSFAEEAQHLIAAIQKAQDHMVLVKGGTFEMGDVMGDWKYYIDEVHSVTVSNFLLAKNELTFDEYDAFCKATGRALPGDEGWGRGKRPVINVDWYDAIEYCNWRSGQEGLQLVYSINKNSKDSNNSSTSDTKKWLVTTSLSANGYRLPTEAEWEYAARQGGQKVRFGNGKDIADPQEINFDASFGYKKPYSVVSEYRQKTLPVGSFSPNTLDLFDMSGNVYEWCGDWFGPYPSSASNDPQGATGGSGRVIRGGSWNRSPADVRVADRNCVTPVSSGDIIGFRLARAIVSPEKQRELETWNKIPKNDLSSLEGYIRDNTQSSFVEEAQHLIAAIQKAQDHMVLVKGGTFQMGEAKESHQVTLSDFLIAKHQLTFEEYDAFCKSTGRVLPDDMGWGRGSRPVIFVSWFDAVDYCNWRSQQEGLGEVYQINQQQVDANWQASGYRLPTEAEWEYAARGGQQSQGFEYAGSNNIDEVAWYSKNSSSKTQPIGQKKANELGLYDMSGNVWEWCWDWKAAYPSSATNDPKGPDTGSRRVVRGGSWGCGSAIVRVAIRYDYTPDYRYSAIGFRLARRQ